MPYRTLPSTVVSRCLVGVALATGLALVASACGAPAADDAGSTPTVTITETVTAGPESTGAESDPSPAPSPADPVTSTPPEPPTTPRSPTPPEPEVGVRVDFTPDPDWPQRGPSLSLPASLPGPGAQIAVRGGWGVDLVVPPERTDGHVTCDYYSTDPDENGTVRRTWSFEVVSDEGVESAYDAEDGRVWADISITRSVRTDGRYHETTSFSLAFAEDGSEDPVTAYANDSGDHEVSNGPFSWEFDTTTGIVRATYNTLSRTMSVGDDPGRGQDISIALTVRCPT